MRSTAIHILAKAPIPGQVKTRMRSVLSPSESCLLHEQLVIHTVKQALRADVGPVVLHCGDTNPFFDHLANQYSIQLSSQAAGDLGARITQAFTYTDIPSLLVGCDCPIIDAHQLQLCRDQMLNSQVFVLPAEDGGFGLIGTPAPNTIPFSALLSEIQWGNSCVFQALERNAKKLKIKLTTGAIIWDVDWPTDLQRMMALNIGQA